MGMYRKKPIVIEAIQFTDNFDEIEEFVGGSISPNHGSALLMIATLEGIMHVSPNDWVIKGVQGEFYPCKPDIFTATYEAVESDG